MIAADVLYFKTLFHQDSGHINDKNPLRVQIKAPHRLLQVKTKVESNQFSEQQKQKHYQNSSQAVASEKKFEINFLSS